jgi:hypothetical protein
MTDFDDMVLADCFDEFGIAATFTPAVGSPYAIKVMRFGRDQLNGFGETRIQSDAMTLEARTAQLIAPAAGDQITFIATGQAFKLKKPRYKDDERDLWLLDCYPA